MDLQRRLAYHLFAKAEIWEEVSEEHLAAISGTHVGHSLATKSTFASRPFGPAPQASPRTFSVAEAAVEG